MGLPRAALNSDERSRPLEQSLDHMPACPGGGIVANPADLQDISKKAAA
jgi:hypothetical protein